MPTEYSQQAVYSLGCQNDPDDPVTYWPNKKFDKYALLRDRTLWVQRTYGNEPRMFFDKNQIKLTMEDFVEEDDYTKTELEEFADDLLRTDARRELCRHCRELDKDSLPYGRETGHVEAKAQYDDGQPLLDEEGNQLYLDFPEYECDQGHRWFAGEGKRRDWNGLNPVLMEEHLRHRQRREIYVQSEEAMGKPDPSIVSGIYNRVHRDGRKVNSPEQRRKNGASWYR